MNQEPQLPNQDILQESEFSMEGYDKHIRNARILLFVMAGLNLINLWGLFPLADNPIIIGMICGILLLSIVFVALAFWTKKKPYSAILTALIVYISLNVLSAVLLPATIMQGWIMKIAVIILLILGLRNAKESQDMMEAYGKKQ